MKRSAFITATVVALAAVARGEPKNELSVAAGVDSAYDDNVFNGRGPDWVNRVNPHGLLRVRSERLKLETAYDLGYWTYAFGKAENSLNHRATASLDTVATRRFTFHLADEFVRAEDPGFLARI